QIYWSAPSVRVDYSPPVAGSLHRPALSFLDRGEKIPASRVDHHRGDRRRHHHGLPSPPSQDRRRAVPPRIRPHRIRQAAPQEFSFFVGAQHAAPQPAWLTPSDVEPSPIQIRQNRRVDLHPSPKLPQPQI